MSVPEKCSVRDMDPVHLYLRFPCVALYSQSIRQSVDRSRDSLFDIRFDDPQNFCLKFFFVDLTVNIKKLIMIASDGMSFKKLFAEFDLIDRLAVEPTGTFFIIALRNQATPLDQFHQFHHLRS